MFGISLLTPLAALFVLTAAVPLAAFVVRERRAATVRRVLRVHAPTRAVLVPPAVAIVVLTALVATAAAQPVVVRQRSLTQRSDAQAFVLFDTSLSMQASSSPTGPTRLERAKRLALKLEHALPDLPIGVTSMTDRSLPNLMPTVDRTLFTRTVHQAVGIDRPPPSQPHKGRATTFDAIVPLVESHFFPDAVQRRLLVVFTDGEAAQVSPLLRLTLQRRVSTVFVHVWHPGERIFKAHGKADPNYTADPTSTEALAQIADVVDGTAIDERQAGRIIRAARDAVGHAETHSVASGYARVALAPWFVLAAVVPLAFLLWRRNT
jgi:hypothetical protein